MPADQRQQAEYPSLTSVLVFLFQAKGPVCVGVSSPGHQTKSQSHKKKNPSEIPKAIMKYMLFAIIKIKDDITAGT